MTRIADAIAAYSNVARTASSAVAGPEKEQEGGLDFAGLVKQAVSATVDSTRQAEQVSKSAIAGKADIRDVVTAVSNAELTLETMVGVRDKVINAYQEILRMPI